MGGVQATDLIDDVPASEIAPVVGVNTRRYLPRFARFSKENKKVGWNWAAFFIPGYWLVYRKCYLPGIFALLLNLTASVLSYPLITKIYEFVPESSYTTDVISLIAQNFSQIPRSYLVLACVAGLILLCSGIFFALFGDYIYKNHCVAKAKDLRDSEKYPDPAYAVVRVGGVNLFAPILAYFALQVFSTVILYFI